MWLFLILVNDLTWYNFSLVSVTLYSPGNVILSSFAFFSARVQMISSMAELHIYLVRRRFSGLTLKIGAEVDLLLKQNILSGYIW